ncbi:hypothetical protein SEA_SCENTAE_15 [Gordonia phage SCentae]|nr:hypothetical protein SEA_SCENTAE_15 [Gordonia phage SCentae]
MTWIKKRPLAAEKHPCKPPTYRRKARPPLGHRDPGPNRRKPVPVGPPIPDGSYGDTWMCDDCETVWVIRKRYGDHHPFKNHPFAVWERAGWLTTRRAYRKIGL